MGNLLVILFASIPEFTSQDTFTGRKYLFTKYIAMKMEVQKTGHLESSSKDNCMEYSFC